MIRSFSNLAKIRPFFSLAKMVRSFSNLAKLIRQFSSLDKMIRSFSSLAKTIRSFPTHLTHLTTLVSTMAWTHLTTQVSTMLTLPGTVYFQRTKEVLIQSKRMSQVILIVLILRSICSKIQNPNTVTMYTLQNRDLSWLAEAHWTLLILHVILGTKRFGQCDDVTDSKHCSAHNT